MPGGDPTAARQQAALRARKMAEALSDLEGDAERSIRAMLPEPGEWPHQPSEDAVVAVYRRGLAAYPGGTDLSANQWALSRVAAFLHVHEYGSPDNPEYTDDNDLLPATHPLREAATGKSTPAPPSDRRRGSARNAAGSARTGASVTFSAPVVKSLTTKVRQHNEGSRHRTSLRALKAVYRRGAGAYSVSHRPGMTRNQWAMGRVNAFLRLLDRGTPDDADYTTDNDLLPAGHPRAAREADREPFALMVESLSMAQRKRYATVVRRLPNGSRVYKFPIPDKTHARAALAYLDKSDLTKSERARVIRKAYRVLGIPPSQRKVKERTVLMPPVVDMLPDVNEPDHEPTPAIAEADIIEALGASDARLDKNELVVTILQPGFNRSGARYYPREAVLEAVTSGMFDGRKMFVNHASAAELRDRPERSLTDWVSTIKETWVDPETGAAKARIKVVQNWFGDFLKQLQENESLPDVGLSIFAQGQVQRKKIEGRLTDVVERFTRALSVDWVTEPGAGGRVDAIWESYQPVRVREQEINVLNTMSATEAVATLREQRPDIVEVLESDRKAETEALEAAEQAAKELAEVREAEQARVAELEATLEERERELVELRTAALAAQQQELVREAVSAAELPTVAKERVAKAFDAVVLNEEGALDTEAITAKVTELVEAEVAYAAELVREVKPAGGRGIAGLGDREESDPKSTTDLVAEKIARRMGIAPTEEPAA